MTWNVFWSEFTQIVSLFTNIISSFPTMILDIVFAVVSFAAVWVLVKMIREVRS